MMKTSAVPRALALACAALALLSAAPAAAQEESAGTPARMPVMNDPTGVGALAAGVLVRLRNAGMHGTRGTFVLRTGPGGADPEVRFVGADLPAAALEQARPAVDAFLAQWKDGRAHHVSFRVGEETLAVVAGDWDWDLDQAPALLNARPIERRLSSLATTQDRSVAAERGTEVSLLISPAGNVLAVAFSEPGEDAALERQLTEVAYAMRWEPARREGQPVPTWMTYRFGLRRPS
ncbi:MAG TPA: hypothetical protein VF746_03790 [Longimicrobium sp.]|jgi:hypothetical protein